MIVEQEVEKILNVFYLKKNESLSEKEKKDMLSEIVLSIFNEGKEVGAKKLLNKAKDLLDTLYNLSI